MKKTITFSLLFAAASLAAYAEDPELTSIYSSGALTLSSDGGDTQTITLDSATTADKDKSFITSSSEVGYGDISITFTIDSMANGSPLNLISINSTGGQTFGVNLSSKAGRGGGQIIELYWGDSLIKTVYTNTEYTLTLAMNGSSRVAISLEDTSDSSVDSDSRVVTGLTGSFKSIVIGNTSSIGTGSSSVSVASATARAAKKKSDAVPEPTTATLSLLALAGLAARRRRK